MMTRINRSFAQPNDKCVDGCEKTISPKSALTCKLTTTEFRARKTNVIASLKNKIEEKK